MLHLISATLALLAGLFFWFWLTLLEKRRQLDGLPQPPTTNWYFGHLKLAGDLRKLFPPGIHPHAWPHYMRKKYNLGDVFYVDWWPLGPRTMFIADAELTSQYVTTGQSLPKSPAVADFLNRFLGDENMVTLEGAQWKSLRSIFNPGFSATHLMTLVPYIVDASLVFCKVMRTKAQAGEVVELEEITTRLTVDIIGKVVLDADFNSQLTTHPIVEAFRERVVLLPVKTGILPWEDFDLFRPIKLWFNQRRLDNYIGSELDKKLADRLAKHDGDSSETGAGKSFKDRKRSIVDLALDAYQKELAASGNEKERAAVVNGHVNPAFRRQAIDSFKTFIFAGHDTTSSTIAYAMYLLHLHHPVHEKLVAELNSTFGNNCTASSIAQSIKEDHYSINKLEYMTAVIKETLRLFPPASTLRWVPETSDPTKMVFLTDTKTGRKYPMSGWQIWPASHMVQRNEAYFPNAPAFIPERFIPAQTPFPEAKLFTPAGKDAWRPFEKGPRNCIGQELAMIETKIILALIVKDFDFVAEYNGVKLNSWTPIETVDEYADGIEGSRRMRVEGHRCFQVLKGSAKPAGSMPGRIYLRP